MLAQHGTESRETTLDQPLAALDALTRAFGSDLEAAVDGLRTVRTDKPVLLASRGPAATESVGIGALGNDPERPRRIYPALYDRRPIEGRRVAKLSPKHLRAIDKSFARARASVARCWEHPGHRDRDVVVTSVHVNRKGRVVAVDVTQSDDPVLNTCLRHVLTKQRFPRRLTHSTLALVHPWTFEAR